MESGKPLSKYFSKDHNSIHAYTTFLQGYLPTEYNCKTKNWDLQSPKDKKYKNEKIMITASCNNKKIML